MRKVAISLLSFLILAQNLFAQKPAKIPSPLFVNKEGRIEYLSDEKGNRIPNYSYAGYKSGEDEIPTIPVRVVVSPVDGDATSTIQSALDYVGSLPLSKDGFRGAVLLEKGTFNVGGNLRINSSGVILRGSGTEPNGTVILGTGLDRETLIFLGGEYDRVLSKDTLALADVYSPVGSMTLTLQRNSLKIGDDVLVVRSGTDKWINELGTDHFGGGISSLGWKSADMNIFWDRTVVAVTGNEITLNAPITTAIDPFFGGGFVCAYKWQKRASNIGIENLSLQSTYDHSNPKDEAHRWMAIVVENAEDGWVRQVNFKHFAGSAVAIWETARRITVEDCKSLEPISEIGGQRRYTFYTSGHQTLFQRCYAEHGYHDFAVGYCASGPNAFVQCQSVLPYNYSGTIDAWASGVLLDVVNVDGNALGFINRHQDGNGAGWTGANSLLWNCSAAKMYNEAPPTAQNWSFGSWAQFIGEGYWNGSNNHMTPRSLYYAQLADRLGVDVSERAQLLLIETNATSSPTVNQAVELTALSKVPAPLLSDWIDSAKFRNPILTDADGAKNITQIRRSTPKVKFVNRALSMGIKNGWIVRDNAALVGPRIDIQWWNGSIKPRGIAGARPHITRYVPGRVGLGYTDDLEEVTGLLVESGIVGMEHNYGLWYERRRDDHERIRRMDGEVWAPFYEQPFARSGKELAWDGLSKYDLTKYNSWYWSRLKKYADLADQKGLLLVQQHYFQHNILEAGAHWADSPWRTANNINNTQFPEPPPYAGDKRIFMAEEFYDISNPVRRALHTAYIRQCLNNFVGNTSVIHLISAEYTGPLHFVEFWLDVIEDWEKETGNSVLVGLSATKDVQDAILADKKRSSVVDIIDIRYWWYQNNGEVYAPKGGQNLAPRQHARITKSKPTSFDQVYRAVLEYKANYPEKSVVYSSQRNYGWAEFMAGGSLAPIPIKNSKFLTAATEMIPVKKENFLMLSNSEGESILYLESSDVELDLSEYKGRYIAQWISSKDGSFYKKAQTIKGGDKVKLISPADGMNVVWIRKN